MGMNSRRVLVVEDERDIARLLALHLEDLGCEVDTSYDGRTGLARALDGTAWSLLVLDLRLPELDGLEICRRVRSSTTYTPILMLTARASELDRVLGLEPDPTRPRYIVTVWGAGYRFCAMEQEKTGS